MIFKGKADLWSLFYYFELYVLWCWILWLGLHSLQCIHWTTQSNLGLHISIIFIQNIYKKIKFYRETLRSVLIWSYHQLFYMELKHKRQYFIIYFSNVRLSCKFEKIFCSNTYFILSLSFYKNLIFILYLEYNETWSMNWIFF